MGLVALVGVLTLAAQAAAPLAGSPIGNQATATYTDAGNTQRTATSNTVITYVAQVASFTLTTDGQQKTAAPGTQVSYPHTITNTGNGTDTFNLTATNAAGDGFDLANILIYADANGDGVPDNNTPITSTGPLAPGASMGIVVVGIVPADAGDAAQAAVNVTAEGTATATPAPVQTNVDTTTVTLNNAVVNVTKTMSATSGTAGSGPYTVTLTYTNTGNGTAKDLTLSDTLPAGMNYVAGSGQWSISGTAALAETGTNSASGNTLVYAYNGGTRTVAATVGSVGPGESRTVSFQVTIPAGTLAGVLPNTVQFKYDPDGDGPGGVGTPTPSNTFNFTVLPTPAVDIAGETVASANQGGTVFLHNTVTNNGNAPDTFDILPANVNFPAGTTFQLYKSDGNTPLVDTDGNGVADTGVLAVGESYVVVLKAVLPPGAKGDGPYTVTKTARSLTNPNVTDIANDVLNTIAGSSVDLTNTTSIYTSGSSAPGYGPGPEASPVLTATANPGTTVRIPIYVNNTSPNSDTYNLSAPTLPAGWSVVFHDADGAVITNTGIVLSGTGSAGSGKLVYADVTVPANEAPGVNDLGFKATSPTTGATDTIHDAITVNTVRSIGVTPNNTGQAYPGGTVIYTHTLTNDGNVAEGGAASTLGLLPAESQSGWVTVIYQDTNANGVIDSGEPIIGGTNSPVTLPPHSSMKIIVKVFAPPGAALGEVNTTTVTFSANQGSYAVAAPASAVATDTTTVINGDLQIVKEQALDPSATGNTPMNSPLLTWTTADISSAKPGAFIKYRITVSNSGSAPATSVKVYDSTPSFTTYSDTVAAAITGQGTSLGVTTAPANGATGALEFNVGTLAPGESAMATFQVQINQ